MAKEPVIGSSPLWTVAQIFQFKCDHKKASFNGQNEICKVIGN